MQFFAGLEPDGFARCDAYLGPGAGIAADAGLAGANAEDAEAAKFDAIACCQGLLEPLKDGVDSRFSLGTRQACPLDDVMDNILLDQCRSPLSK